MNSLKAASLLLDKGGASVNAIDDCSATPLHYAVAGNHLEMTVLLLDRGADLTLTDKDKLTPAELLFATLSGSANNNNNSNNNNNNNNDNNNSNSNNNKGTTAAEQVSKAILMILLRHYQKNGLSVPKNIAEKLGVPSSSSSTTTEGVAAIVQKQIRALLLQQQEKEKGNRPARATSAINFRPFSVPGFFDENNNEEKNNNNNSNNIININNNNQYQKTNTPVSIPTLPFSSIEGGERSGEGERAGSELDALIAQQIQRLTAMTGGGTGTPMTTTGTTGGTGGGKGGGRRGSVASGMNNNSNNNTNNNNTNINTNITSSSNSRTPMTIYDQLFNSSSPPTNANLSSGGQLKAAPLNRFGSFVSNVSSIGAESQEGGMGLGLGVVTTTSNNNNNNRRNKRNSFLFSSTGNQNNESSPSPGPTNRRNRRQSFLTNTSTGSGGTTKTSSNNNNNTKDKDTNNNNLLAVLPTTTNVDILGVLEENRQYHLNRTNQANASPGGGRGGNSRSPELINRPRFSIRKIGGSPSPTRSVSQDGEEEDYDTSDLINGLDLDGPGKRRGRGRDQQKNRKIAQSMAAVPELFHHLSLEEFFQENNMTGERRRTAAGTATGGMNSKNLLNNLLLQQDNHKNNSTTEGENNNNTKNKPRRHISAPEITVPQEVLDLIKGENHKNKNNNYNTSSVSNSGEKKEQEEEEENDFRKKYPLQPFQIELEQQRLQEIEETRVGRTQLLEGNPVANLLRIVTSPPRGAVSAASNNNNNNNSNNTLTTAVSLSSALVAPKFLEMAYPPAEILPFLPSPLLLGGGRDGKQEPPEREWSPDHLDVIVAVEHCCDCSAHNDQSLRHNEVKYVSTANALLYSLIRALAQSKLAIRLYALRSKPLITDCPGFRKQHQVVSQRLGALEVTIAVRINLPELVTEVPVLLTNTGPIITTTVNTPGKNTTNSKKQSNSNNNNLSPSRVPPIAGDQQQQQTPIVAMREQRGHVKWVTHRLFSKLETKR
jgi:hypothetical protein